MRTGDPGSSARRRDAARFVALALAALALFPFLARSGIWDPYELDAADLARRIAIHTFGAKGLALPGAASAMPTLTDLRMGELGFTSMALGFRLLGLHDWAGRLPLALWGFAGAMVLYELVARLVDRRAGLYTVVALVTMPLYAIQARTMLGDIVTMAALSMAFCGLAGAVLDNGRLARAVWLAVGVFGVAAGYLSRGLLIGVAVPLLGVGVAWMVLVVSAPSSTAPHSPRSDLEDQSADPPGHTVTTVLGAGMCILGAAAAARGIQVLVHTGPLDPLPRALGVALLKKAPVESTFDLTIRQLGHGLFPWSALLPFAFGRMLRTDNATAREVGLRVAALVTAAFAYAAFALLAPYAGQIAWSGPALLAIVIGLVVRDLDRGAPPSWALAVGCGLLAFVLYRDFAVAPARALGVFAVDKVTFPKSFEGEAQAAMKAVFVVFAGLVGLSWIEPRSRALEPSFAAWARRGIEAYRRGLVGLNAIWGGNLVFAFIVVEASLVGLGLMLFVGKYAGWSAAAKLPQNIARYGVNAWWAVPLIVGLAPVILAAIRDGFRLIVERAGVPRAAGTLAAGLLAGSMLTAWYYPALASQLSPREVFESYARFRSPGEPLGVLGIRSRAAAYYQGGEVEGFPDVGRAFMWLTAVPERRWLVVKAEDLPKLNSLYRKKMKQNLPVLDGRSSQILLTSNDLGGHRNESWITSMVLDDVPAIAHPVEAMFEDQIEVLGWEVTNDAGKSVESVVPQSRYHFRTYFRVRRQIGGNWKMFIHIDGFQRRYNGDHAILDGRYPLSLWQPGDVIVDDHVFQLEPNFTPGDYAVYFGFFIGDSRLRVTHGPETENRIIGGRLRVR